MRKYLAAAIFFGAMASSAFAEEAACFRAAPLTAELVTDGLAGQDAAPGFPGADGVPPFIAGHLSYMRPAALEPPEGKEAGPYGSVLFVRDDAAKDWRAIVPYETESAVGIFVTPGSVVFAVTQLQVAGYGQSFTIMRSTKLKSATCATLPFPKALNNPEWAMETLELATFAMDARGRGALIASAELGAARGKPRMTWWRYDTRDGGKTWSRAYRIPAAPKRAPSALAPVAAPASPAEIASLTAFATGK